MKLWFSRWILDGQFLPLEKRKFSVPYTIYTIYHWIFNYHLNWVYQKFSRLQSAERPQYKNRTINIYITMQIIVQYKSFRVWPYDIVHSNTFLIKRNRSFQVLARYIPVVMSHQLVLWPCEYIYTWLMESVVKWIGSGTVVHFENRGWHGFLNEERSTHVYYIVVFFQLTITTCTNCTCINYNVKHNLVNYNDITCTVYMYMYIYMYACSCTLYI